MYLSAHAPRWQSKSIHRTLFEWIQKLLCQGSEQWNARPRARTVHKNRLVVGVPASMLDLSPFPSWYLQSVIFFHTLDSTFRRLIQVRRTPGRNASGPLLKREHWQLGLCYGRERNWDVRIYNGFCWLAFFYFYLRLYDCQNYKFQFVHAWHTKRNYSLGFDFNDLWITIELSTVYGVR